MAIRQYIGARYVPKYMGTFDSTIAYEPLSVVDDANGNSYTSKIPVPAGTDLSNRTYWAPTGNFSGAVLQLQNRMTTAEGNITDLTREVSALDTAVGGLIDADEQITQRIDAIETEIGPVAIKKFLIVSDSYGEYKDPNNKSFAELAAEITGMPVEMVWQGSTGFGAALKFTDVLASYSGDKTKITDIIVVGGANDMSPSVSETAINEGIVAFLNYARANFPLLQKVHLFACGVSYYNGIGVNDRKKTIDTYKTSCSRAGDMLYVDNAQYILFNRAFLTDTTHPTADGVTQIGRNIATYIKKGSIKVEYFGTYTLVAESGTVSNPNVGRMRLIDGNFSMMGNGFNAFLNLAWSSPIGVGTTGLSSFFKVGTYNNMFIDMQDANNDYFFQLPCRLKMNDDSYTIGRVSGKIVDNELWIQMQTPVIQAIKECVTIDTLTLFPFY